MTYTTIAIVILVIDMGMLTLAVKCNDAAGVVDCVAAKVCKYEAGSLTGERCSNDEALVDEIGKCVKKPATGMDQTPNGKPATACKNFNNKKCESSDTQGCPGESTHKCKYTKAGGAVNYECAETGDCADGKDTCCIQADDTKTGGWVKDGNGPSDCTWKVKGPTSAPSGAKNITSGAASGQSRSTKKPESPSPSASTSSEYLKMPLWAAAAILLSLI